MKFCEEKLQISQKILVAADGSKFICKRVFIYLDKKQVKKQQGLLPYQEHEYHIPLKAKEENCILMFDPLVVTVKAADKVLSATPLEPKQLHTQKQQGKPKHLYLHQQRQQHQHHLHYQQFNHFFTESRPCTRDWIFCCCQVALFQKCTSRNGRCLTSQRIKRKPM